MNSGNYHVSLEEGPSSWKEHSSTNTVISFLWESVQKTQLGQAWISEPQKLWMLFYAAKFVITYHEALKTNAEK